jgi:hypothetical protein
LQETLRVSREVLTGQIAASLQNQQALQNDVRDLSDKSDKLTENIDDSIVPKLADMAATAGQTAREVTALASGQAALQQSIQAGNAALAARASELHQSLQAHNGKTDQQAADLANVQKEMQTSLDTLTATAGQTALDVIAMTARQDTIRAALHSHGETLGARMVQLTNGQQQMQSSLDTVTATTGQTGLDILGLTNRQEAVQATLQSQNETLGVRMAQLVDNQQEIRSSLDTVTATTGQASLDTLALNDGQSRLGQAVQAGRQETADKLAGMTQDQQKWSERLDAAQAKVTTVGESVAALEQRVAKLQDLLQVSLQSTAAILDATSQQRLQFEAKVSQDLQAVIASLVQLRQTQTSLQEQIAQVQKSTEGQADSLRSVIQQMKTSPNAQDRARDETPDVEDVVGAAPAQPAPAEVQVSQAVQVPPAPPVPQAAE